jgi:competence protein ComEC
MLLIIITLLSACDKTPQLAIHVIDVGQGDAMLIQTPSKKNILIDGGDENADHMVKSYLRKKWVKSIDLIIATHPDSDHIGGLDNVVDAFDVKSIYMTEKSSDSESYINLIKSCKNKNLDIQYLNREDNLNIENELSLQVLSPSNINDENNLASIVLYMKYKDNEFILTGDSEKENEQEILNTYDINDVDFLKVAHHGSNTSSSPEFISKISPDISVISCGYKNQYGHPHKETLNSLYQNDSSVYRTDKIGDIVFYSDGDKIFTKKNYDHD